jgi:hypothetical protein
MPVFIFDPDAFEKMVKVEGEEYRGNKTKETFSDCSFDAFLEKWESEYKGNADIINFRPKFGISVNGIGAIYGLGGFNRYAVLNSGEITFIEAQSRTSACTELAKREGFRLW